MTLEEFLIIGISIFLAIAYLIMKLYEKNTYVLGIGWAIKHKIYLWCQNNVYIKRKEQKVGVRTKWWRK